MPLRKTRHLNVYIAIKELSETHGEYSVNEMRRILGINRAVYYKWKNHVRCRNDSLNERIAEKAEVIVSLIKLKIDKVVKKRNETKRGDI